MTVVASLFAGGPKRSAQNDLKRLKGKANQNAVFDCSWVPIKAIAGKLGCSRKSAFAMPLTGTYFITFFAD